MRYLYVAATEEVEREALAVVTARVAAEFDTFLDVTGGD